MERTGRDFGVWQERWKVLFGMESRQTIFVKSLPKGRFKASLSDPMPHPEAFIKRAGNEHIGLQSEGLFDYLNDVTDPRKKTRNKA